MEDDTMCHEWPYGHLEDEADDEHEHEHERREDPGVPDDEPGGESEPEVDVLVAGAPGDEETGDDDAEWPARPAAATD